MNRAPLLTLGEGESNGSPWGYKEKNYGLLAQHSCAGCNLITVPKNKTVHSEVYIYRCTQKPKKVPKKQENKDETYSTMYPQYTKV